MSRVFVAGLGAVSPAGWNVAALCEALNQGQPLPTQPLARPGWKQPLRARLVPHPSTPPQFLAHPRLRRTSQITHYAAAAALESVARLRANQNGKRRLGVVVCVQSGCVNYSCRFLAEVLKDPATASPVLFPETVYAGPASHVATLLGEVSLTYTLVGDSACFLQGVAVAAQWLADNRVDACIVVGSEESDWIIADALRHLDRPAVLAGGAGALCLCRDPKLSAGADLLAITDAHTYSASVNRERAACAVRGQLGVGSSEELLCDGIGDSPGLDAAERAAWHDWRGARLSPKRVLGEGLIAGGAWQCVAACEAVASGRFNAANVSLVGSNQQAIGARFVRAAAGPLDLPAGVSAASASP
jgi:3-oxoacyl-(acyl-carrier-protein) synthase